MSKIKFRIYGKSIEDNTLTGLGFDLLELIVLHRQISAALAQASDSLPELLPSTRLQILEGERVHLLDPSADHKTENE